MKIWKTLRLNLTSTPISPGVQPNDQATLKVPSVKFQSSAIVSTSSTTTPVTTPALVSDASMNPIARPFVPESVPIKEEEYKDKYKTPTDYTLSHVKNVGAVSERIQALWKVQGQIETILTSEGNRQNCQKRLLFNGLGVSYLVTSHRHSLEMLCHTQHP